MGKARQIVSIISIISILIFTHSYKKGKDECTCKTLNSIYFSKSLFSRFTFGEENLKHGYIYTDKYRRLIYFFLPVDVDFPVFGK